MQKIVTKGVVLRATETREADYILTMLTDTHGKLPVIARGARRRNSKFAAACQLFALSELVLYERGDWFYLDEASTVEQFTALRGELERLALGSYFAELCETLTAENVPAPELLSLFLNALYALSQLKKPCEQVRAAFELKLLSFTGYEPLLDECAACGEKEPGESVFDAQAGVLLCRRCAETGGGHALDAPSLCAMRHIVRAPGKRMLSFSLAPPSQRLMNEACEAFVRAQLERDFKTLSFYRSLL